MDALLLALLGCLAVETGDKGQQLTLALARRYGGYALIAGLIVAAFANAMLSAAAGWYLSVLMGDDARSLLLALALIFGGIGLIITPKMPDTLENWRIGAFLTAALGLFILGFGDGAQFLLLGIATRTGDPVLTALGGGLGLCAAYIPIALQRRLILPASVARALRLTAAAIFLIAGAVMAVGAMGIA